MAVLFVALVLAGAPTPREKLPYLRGTVGRIIDGDSLEVTVSVPTRSGEITSRVVEVRLYGIDAPERGQEFGPEATRALEDLVNGREVELFDVGPDGRGRTLAFVHVDGRDVGAELVGTGYAWAYRHFLGKVEGDARFCTLEYAAREAQAGLWAAPRQRAPWLHRKESRRKGRTRFPAEHGPEDCVARFGK